MAGRGVVQEKKQHVFNLIVPDAAPAVVVPEPFKHYPSVRLEGGRRAHARAAELSHRSILR